jgi:hypothetical protein
MASIKRRANKLLKKAGMRLTSGRYRTKSAQHHGWVRLFLEPEKQRSLRLEWVLGDRDGHLLFDASIDEENSCTVAVASLWAALYATVPSPPTVADLVRRLASHPYGEVRVVRLGIHSGSLFWSFLHPAYEWSSTTPRYRDGWLSFHDLLAGKAEYSEELLEHHEIIIPMPEGTYNWTADLKRRTWTRPRGRTQHSLNYDLNAADGEQIPIPGKGENSWDCGPDAIHGTGAAESEGIAGAISTVVRSALRSRIRYLGTVHYASGGKYDPEQKSETAGKKG